MIACNIAPADHRRLLAATASVNCHCVVLNSKLQALRSLNLMSGQQLNVPPYLALMCIEQLQASGKTSDWQAALEAQLVELDRTRRELMQLLK